MRMGLPHVILSDNGKEFNNELDNILSDLLGTKRTATKEQYDKKHAKPHILRKGN